MIPSLAKLTLNARTEKVGVSDADIACYEFLAPDKLNESQRKAYAAIESCSSILLNDVLSSLPVEERKKWSCEMFVASMYFVFAYSGMFGLIKHNMQSDYRYLEGKIRCINQDMFLNVTKLVGLVLARMDELKSKECVDMLTKLSRRCSIDQKVEFDSVMAEKLVAYSIELNNADKLKTAIPVPASQLVESGTEYVDTQKKGSYGNLLRKMSIPGNEVVSAVKRIQISLDDYSGYDLLRIVREVVVMREIKRKMVEDCEDKPLMTLINFHFWVSEGIAVFDLEMPFATDTVWSYVQMMQMNSNLKRSICEQILQGLKHLHAMCVVHLDLKPKNMLVFPQGDKSVKIKIIDFGASRYLLQPTLYQWTSTKEASHVTTVTHEPPELLNIDEEFTYTKQNVTYSPWFCFSYKADIWSAAMCIFYVQTDYDLMDIYALQVQTEEETYTPDVYWMYIRASMVIFALLSGMTDLGTVKDFWSEDEMSNLKIFEKDSAATYALSNIRQSDISDNLEIYHSKLQSIESEEYKYLRDLLKHMLHMDLEKRYSAEQCLDHKFFSKT